MEANAVQIPDNVIQIPQQTEKKESLWIKTPVTNLYKYAPSGMYFCMAKVRGRLIRRSLKTKSYEIAKIKLDQMIASERGRISSKADEDINFKDLAEKYEAILQARTMEPGSRRYRMDTLKQIRKCWPGIDKLKPREFAEPEVTDWAHSKLHAKYQKGRFNGAVETLRGIMQIAVDLGLILTNPVVTRKRNSTRGIILDKVGITPPTILTKEQFAALLKALDDSPSRRRAALAVRFLAYSGQRIGASTKVYPEDVDMEHNELIIRKDKRQEHPRRIPMCAELRALVEKLLKDHPGFGPLLEIKSPRKALKHACRDIKIDPPITPHDLRHLFATQCIERGIDQRTLAELLGHKDGGRLAMRVYAHVRRAHAQDAAAKIVFGAEKVDREPTEQLAWDI